MNQIKCLFKEWFVCFPAAVSWGRWMLGLWQASSEATRIASALRPFPKPESRKQNSLANHFSYSALEWQTNEPLQLCIFKVWTNDKKKTQTQSIQIKNLPAHLFNTSTSPSLFEEEKTPQTHRRRDQKPLSITNQTSALVSAKEERSQRTSLSFSHSRRIEVFLSNKLWKLQRSVSQGSSGLRIEGCILMFEKP